ncbi:MAG: hypothetical protein KF784_07415 [Fimbriimonadaceae bacterium]|nr:hypothetical protein [Fimbriimonadaceae bacterium]
MIVPIMRTGTKLAIGIFATLAFLALGIVVAWPSLEVRFSSDDRLAQKLSEIKDTQADATFTMQCLNLRSKNIRLDALARITGFKRDETRTYFRDNSSDTVRGFLSDPDPVTRAIALETCGHLSLLTKTDVDNFLDDPDEFVRTVICELIREYKLEYSGEKVWRIARTDTYRSAVRATRILAELDAKNLLTLSTEKGHKPDRNDIAAGCLSLLSDSDYLMMISRHKEWVNSRDAAMNCVRSIGAKSHLLDKTEGFLHEIAEPYTFVQERLAEELDFVRRHPETVKPSGK